MPYFTHIKFRSVFACVINYVEPIDINHNIIYEGESDTNEAGASSGDNSSAMSWKTLSLSPCRRRLDLCWSELVNPR